MGILRKKTVSVLVSLSFGLLPLSLMSDALSMLTSGDYKERQWKTVYTEPLREDEIGFQWLGTTGYKVQKGGFIVLIDPYLTRVPLEQLFLAPLVPDTRLLAEKVPKADYIFVTDSHFDHFMDVPPIALRTGAKVVGSPTTAKLLRLFKVPEEQIVEVRGGETLRAGPFAVKVAPAEHGKIFCIPPFYGDIDPGSRPPLYVWEYANLENRCYHFSLDGFSFLATSGTGLEERVMRDFKADLVMMNVTALPAGYARKLVRLASPKVVFPTHYDNFFEPYDRGVIPWPFQGAQILREIAESAPGVSVVTLDFFQEYRVALPFAAAEPPQAAVAAVLDIDQARMRKKVNR
jgi:L-ascorbate metabolism protein UlaG (beta-lactamase superfamily)